MTRLRVVPAAQLAGERQQPREPVGSLERGAPRPAQVGYLRRDVRGRQAECERRAGLGLQWRAGKRPRQPRELTPAFYGCYDWHSSVHGHWLLALAGELRSWEDPQAREWAEALQPLEVESAQRIMAWLPKLQYPIRSGEHSQTAFAFGLIADWAQVRGDVGMARLLESRGRLYYGRDRDCALAYEPSGEDFLSPCLAEADFMRRILPRDEYAVWLTHFLPAIPTDGSAGWLAPGIVTDRSDPKLAHIDGLNLSRAWMLEGIAGGLPAKDRRRAALLAASRAHAAAALPAVTGEHYEGGHWLGTFAVYLTSRAGIRE